MSDRTQDLKNLRAVATACKNYVDETKEQILWQVGQYDITTQDDNTTAYQKVVPTGATRAKIKSIGGMSYKSENLIVLQDVAETTTNGITYKIENGVITLNGTATSNTNINLVLNNTQFLTGIFATFNSQVNSNVSIYNLKYNGSWGSIGFSLNGVNKTYNIIDNTDLYGFRLYIKVDTEISNFVIKPMLVSGSTAPTTYKQGFTGIRDSAITSVKSYDSNNNLIDTYTIDSNIQALEGYGRGINSSVYNMLDLNTKVFTDKDIKFTLSTADFNLDGSVDNRMFRTRLNNDLYTAIGQRTFGDRNGADPDAMCDYYPLGYYAIDGTWYFASDNYLRIRDTTLETKTDFNNKYTNGLTFMLELATYNTTDNLELPNNVIKVEAGGYLVFENQYGQAVPSNITYRIEVAK